MRLRRRGAQDPEARRRFGAVATALAAAQRALLTAIPTARDPGAPLADALAAFARGLDDVERSMPGWRTPATEEWWRRCEEALREARSEAERLRASPPGPTEFEALNARVGDVLAPLEDFADAERALAGRRV